MLRQRPAASPASDQSPSLSGPETTILCALIHRFEVAQEQTFRLRRRGQLRRLLWLRLFHRQSKERLHALANDVTL